MLMAPSADRTESVLVEATSELKEGVQFPSFEEISRFVTSQSPTEERSEFSSEIAAASGNQFQISGVRTGAFGVIAVAVTPLENSANVANVSLAMRLAIGIAIALSLLVMLVQTLRFRLNVNRQRSALRPETIQVEEIT